MVTSPRTIRFTDEEWRRYTIAAGAADKSVSAWIRDACDRLAPPPNRKAAEIRCTEFRHTGPFDRLGYATRCQGCGQAVR
jgi:hypothetical protein